MKNLYIFLLIIPIFFTACNNSGKNNSAEERNSQVKEVAALKTISMEVKGMTCEGCENTIESALTEIDGVVSAEASHTKAVAVVSYDSTKVTTQTLAQTINELGYQAVN